MSMSWGGVIASALAGGAAGAMGSVAKDIDDEQKAAIQAKRDAALAKLAQETHKVNAETSAKVALDNVGPMAKAASDAKSANVEQDAATANKQSDLTRASRTADDQAKEDTKYNKYGQEIWKGGKKIGSVEKDAEEERRAQELHDARVESLEAGSEAKRARAGKDNRGGGGGSGEEKPRNEKPLDWKKTEDQPRGMVRYFDKNTGYYMEVTPAKEAKKGDKGVVNKLTLGLVDAFVDPDTPAVEEKRVYKDAEGKTVPFDVVEAKRREVSGLKPVESQPAAGTVDFADAKKQADAAIARSPKNAAAIKARFKTLTGKEYR